MSTGNNEGNAKASKKPSFVGLVSRSVDPFEEADREDGHSNQTDDNQVQKSHLKLTVHAVVKWRESRARDQDIDASIVETIGNGVNH